MKKILLLIMVIFCTFLNAQTFTEVDFNLPSVFRSSTAWGDYDNDGDLDILISGQNETEGIISRIYRNDLGIFTDINAGLIGVYRGSVAWGDYDNDSDLDILISGQNQSGEYIAEIYRNDSGIFTGTNAGLAGFYKSSVAWGDYDNDGDLDIVATDKNDADENISKIYRNDSGVFIDINAGLASMYNASASWGDYDNDGDLDILLTGFLKSIVYRNDSGIFTNINAGLFNVINASSTWGDYDNDGDLDILLSGYNGSEAVVDIFQNNSGTFTAVNAGLQNVLDSSVAWGDYDNDGDLDIIITGQTNYPFVSYTKIYQNEGHNIFTGINQQFADVLESSVVWGDYDNDNDLDILLTGNGGSYIYKNNITAKNTIPSSPTNLSSSVNGNNVTLSWNKATDNETPQNGLSYNLYIGTTSMNGNENTPMSNIQTGYRKVVNIGNANQNTSWTIKDLSWGTYYWSVQAIDHAYAGSEFAPEKSYTIQSSAPTVPIALEATSISTNTFTANWVAFNGAAGFKIDIDDNIDFSSPLVNYNNLDVGNIVSKIITGLTPNSIYYYRIRYYIGNVTSDYSNVISVNTYRFTPIGNVTAGGDIESTVALGDYDNDDDLDIVVINASDSRIYRNDSGVFIDINAGIIGLSNAATAWGDYDNDGDLDILLSGSNTSVGLISRIYRNNSGVFTDINAGIIGVYNGTVDWGDYDNDGDLDIILTGSTSTINISKIYRNDLGIFTDINAGIIGMSNGTTAWGDYDNDGDLDIILTGSTGSINTAKIYRNDENSVFTDINLDLSGGYDCSADWGDYDNDGDLDIVLAIDINSAVYRNDGNGVFTDINAGLSNIYEGTAKWGDFDNDGDLDALLSGYNDLMQPRILICRNDMGVFTEQNAGINHRYNNVSAELGDFDNDGDLDLIYASYNVWFYRNDVLTSNTIPNSPINLTSSINGNDVAFSWEKATDSETPQNGLSYNLYVGTTSLNGNINTPMSDTQSGYRKVVNIGNASQNTSWTIKDLPDGTYYWSVQAIDHAFAGSDFAGEKVIVKSAPIFTNASISLPSVFRSSTAWGDYDNDGDLDILISGQNETEGIISRIYRNDLGIFTDINAGLIGVYRGSVAWGDYDNDGDLDILISGQNQSGEYIAEIYRNDSGIFTGTNAGLAGFYKSSVAWGDYDNDGDLDIVATDKNDADENISKIYRNDSGVFIDINAGLAGMYNASASWGDYDNDGDLDILLTGFLKSIVYRNDSGIFTNINAGLFNVINASSTWGDYDNDGDLDILLSGYNGSEAVVDIFQNNSGTFTAVNAGLQNVLDSSVAWGDYDNDGDLDIIITGQTNYPFVSYTKIYQNEGHNIFTGINQQFADVLESSVVWGDYDNDNDLDILLTGNGGSYIYKNNITAKNTIPSSPTNLTSSVNENDITLSWSQATDNETPQNGLSYNLYIGTASMNGNINTPMSNIQTGYRKVVNIGNANQNTSWTIKDLPDGTYYWSVQAVDHALAGSEFESEKVCIKSNPMFTNANINLSSVSNGSSAWGDYDNDGDLDILMTGDSGSGYISRIYKNDNGIFTDINAGLTGVAYGTTAWGDYDNDGDLDILFTGKTTTSNISRIYRNDNGIFTDIDANLTGLANGATAWGDFDNDGDLDILLTGKNIYNVNISFLYRNDEGTYFETQSLLKTTVDGTTALGDYDNDGDLDILLTGNTGSGYISKIYRNDAGSFTDINAGLTGVSNCSAAWGDYDNDGDLDILLTGKTTTSIISKIYRNDNRIFTDINAGLTGIAYSSSAWGDYDNDGDLDILMTGDSGSGYISRIYKNDNGIFTDINAGLTGVSNCSAAWGDYDNDGDLDILLTGSSDSGIISKIYRNDSVVANSAPSLPINLTALTKENLVILQWDKSSDNQTPQNGLSYNIYIGTASLLCDVNSGMSNIQDGFRKVVSLGNVNQNNSWAIKGLPNGQYFWSVQSIDHVYKGSEFSNEQTFNITSSFNEIDAGLPGVVLGSSAWGDYDNDGDLDILIAGESDTDFITKIYRNDNGVFSDINAGLPGIYLGSVAWGDYDNDGDLDILLTGYILIPESYYFVKTSKIYRNDSGSFTDINAGLTGVYKSSVAWGDYDNDGDLDILLTGATSTSSYYNNNPVSKVYRNDSGVFSDINAGLPGVHLGSVAWGDYDNDGDLDILLTGIVTSGSCISKIYRNVGNGVFTDINAGLTGVYASSVAWGDYDNDCDLDILLTGIENGSYKSKIYNNNCGTFTNINAGLPGVCDGSADWGDYDNDGDLDVLLNGCVNWIFTTTIFHNENNVFTDTSISLLGTASGNASWGDYDNDGDLDILLTGASSHTNIVSKLYRNNSTIANTVPSTPENLVSTTNFNSVTLSWDKATDNETPQNGLSYNLYIGTTSMNGNKNTPMSNIQTGYRKVVNIGNANQNTSWTIKNLSWGTFYWSVQAVDHAFAGSEFSEEQKFTLGLRIYADASTVTLEWDENLDAVSYNIYKSNHPDADYSLLDNVTELTYTDYSKNIDYEMYFYYIEAVTSKSKATVQSDKVGYRKSYCYNFTGPDYNDISLPFDEGYTMSNELNPSGIRYRAISKWDAATQSWLTSNYSGSGWANSFPIYPGQCYRINNLSSSFYFFSQGNYKDLPAYNLITTAGSDLNFIMHPVTKYNLTRAGSGVGNDIGVCNSITKFVPTTQSNRNTSKIFGTWRNDYSIDIGLPLLVNMTANVTWPGLYPEIDKSDEVSEINFPKVPKAVYFHVINSQNEDYNFNDTNVKLEGTQPSDGFITFKAWITGREQDILTEENYGCGFEQINGSFSTVFINLGNFKNKWSENDVLNIVVSDKNGKVALEGKGNYFVNYDDGGEFRGFEPKIKGSGAPIVIGTPAGIDEMIPCETALYQNYPNPFNPVTSVKFSLKNDSKVKLFVFNYKGQLVQELFNGNMIKGIHSANFDANKLSSGLYFYTLEVDGKQFVKKMVLTR